LGSYDTFRAEYGRKFKNMAFTLHDGDLLEITGKYSGQGWLGQPYIYGETLQRIDELSGNGE
jgi:hypothetical protein